MGDNNNGLYLYNGVLHLGMCLFAVTGTSLVDTLEMRLKCALSVRKSRLETVRHLV